MRTDAWYDRAPAKARQFKAEALTNFAIDLEAIVSIRLRRWTATVGPGSGADESQNASSDSKRISFLKFGANAELNAEDLAKSKSRSLILPACVRPPNVNRTPPCIDKDASKITALRRGKIPIFEPDLERLVQNNVKNGRLDFDTDLAGPVGEADAVFIAVGTPSRRGDGHGWAERPLSGTAVASLCSVSQ